MMKKLKLVGVMACVLYVMMALPVMAQQRISGHVFNAQTKKPIEAANVTYRTNKGTSTDANGHFSIPCRGSIRITVSYVGYQTFKKTIQNCATPLQIALVPLSYSLNESTVEDEAYIQRAASIGTLGHAELNRQSGLRLKDALNTVPGVEMQTRSPFGGQRITIRGYYPNAGNSANFNGLGYQLFLNDVPITDAAGTTIMDDIDFSTLGRVQVIKGPSPLYGNEIAGTVKLYSQRPQYDGTTLSEQVVAGSYGLFRDNTSLMTKEGNLDIRINYGHQSYDSFRPQDSSKKDYVSLNGHYRVSDKQQISAYFSYNHSDEELAGGLVGDDFYAQRAIASPDYLNNDGGVIIESFRAGVTSSRGFNNYVGNKTTVFATGHTLNQNFAHGFNYHGNLNFGARTNFTYQQQFENVGVKGQLGAFVQKSDESVDGVFIPPSVSPPFTPDTKPQFPTNAQNYALNYNVFTRWEFALPRDFRVSVGGILNFNKFGIRDLLNNGSLYSGSATQSNSFDPTFSSGASVLKSFNDQATVYASVTTGNTPPLLGDVVAENGSINDQLQPEDAVQYEIGSKGHLMNNRFTYQLALFDLEISDRLATQFIDGVQLTTNVGKQQNRGLELSLGYNVIENSNAAVSLLHLWGSYTYSDFTYDDFKVYGQDDDGNQITTANFSGNDVAGVAPHRLSLGVDVQSRPGFYLHAKYKYIDKTPFTFNNKGYVKSFNVVSGRIGYQKQIVEHFNLDAFVGSNNITGSTYYNFLFVGQNADALGDGYINPAPYKATVYGGATLIYNF